MSRQLQVSFRLCLLRQTPKNRYLLSSATSALLQGDPQLGGKQCRLKAKLNTYVSSMLPLLLAPLRQLYACDSRQRIMIPPEM